MDLFPYLPDDGAVPLGSPVPVTAEINPDRRDRLDGLAVRQCQLVLGACALGLLFAGRLMNGVGVRIGYAVTLFL